MILPVVAALRAYLAAWLRSRHSMLLEILALHHALTISRRSMPGCASG
jgi:hypothetical protein